MSKKAHRRSMKRAAFEKFLSDSPSVYVNLDSRHYAVLVPDEFQNNPDLVLAYGLNMKVPIDDLLITDAGIEGTLSFSRKPHFTFIPWDAVFLISSSEGDFVAWTDEQIETVAPVKEAAKKAEAPVEPITLRAVSEKDEPQETDYVAYTGPPNLRLVN